MTARHWFLIVVFLFNFLPALFGDIPLLRLLNLALAVSCVYLFCKTPLLRRARRTVTRKDWH